MEILKGFAHKFGDDVNTDYIISGRYKFKTLNLNQLSTHLFEDLAPDFIKKIREGDFIVGGENFGCGSSREQAPLVIKYAKIGGVLASSFARIFYRNSINVGLPIFICDTRKIENKDFLEIDMVKGEVRNLTRGETLKTTPFPPQLREIISSGGLVKYFKKYGGWK